MDLRSSAGSRAGRAGRRWVLSGLLVLPAIVTLAGPGAAAASVSRAELRDGRLKLEGTAAPSRSITVDGTAMGTSDGSGRFRIERSGFAAPADCTVDVDDGSGTPANAVLSGCTVSSPPTPPAAVSLSALTLSQTTVNGGTAVTGTVTLSAAAPAGGTPVALSSTNTAAATVPPEVVVAAGATSAGFPVTTHPVTNSQSATIVGTAGGQTRSSTLTVVTEFQARNGSVSLARGGTGSGRVTSQPAGIDCTFTATGTSGTCSNAFFAAGTEVRLDARPAAGSKFLGWEFEVSCRDAPKVTVQAGVAHICRPAFVPG